MNWVGLVTALTDVAQKRREIQAGDVFFRLTATAEQRRNPYSNLLRLCTCSCGNSGWYRETMLRKGQTKSCGCWRRDHAALQLPAARAALAINPPDRDPLTGQWKVRP